MSDDEKESRVLSIETRTAIVVWCHDHKTEINDPKITNVDLARMCGKDIGAEINRRHIATALKNLKIERPNAKPSPPALVADLLKRVDALEGRLEKLLQDLGQK